jgi:hypothetical protein
VDLQHRFWPRCWPRACHREAGREAAAASESSPTAATAANGSRVELVASGPMTATAPASGDHAVFEGDAGNGGQVPGGGAVGGRP